MFLIIGMLNIHSSPGCSSQVLVFKSLLHFYAGGKFTIPTYMLTCNCSVSLSSEATPLLI